MAPKQLLLFLFYANIFHFEIDATIVMPMNHGNVLAVDRLIGPSGLGASAFPLSKSPATGGNPSAVAYGKNHSNLKLLLQTRNLVPPNAIRKGDEHAESSFDLDSPPPPGSIDRFSSPDNVYKYEFYHSAMGKFPQYEQSEINLKFVDKLSNTEKPRKDVWEINYLAFPKTVVKEAMAESLVEYTDIKKADVEDALADDLKENAEFMKAIEDAKIKLEKKKERERQENNAINKFMAAKNLKDPVEQGKFMASYQHLYQHKPSLVPMKVKLQTAFDDYNKKKYLSWLPHIVKNILGKDKNKEEE